MTERVMNTKTLPEFLRRLINTEKFRLHEDDTGSIKLTPIQENPEIDRFLAIKKYALADNEDKMRRLYELCGSGADLGMTVDSFIAMTHDETEMNI